MQINIKMLLMTFHEIITFVKPTSRYFLEMEAFVPCWWFSELSKLILFFGWCFDFLWFSIVCFIHWTSLFFEVFFASFLICLHLLIQNNSISHLFWRVLSFLRHFFYISNHQSSLHLFNFFASFQFLCIFSKYFKFEKSV